MSVNKYELRIITKKVEKWLEKISPDDKVLEFLIDELESNPYKRQDDPKLIDSIKGLRTKNPPFWRIRVEKDLGIDKNYRVYYTIVDDDQNNDIKYVVPLDYSMIDEKSKKQTIDRLKMLTVSKLEDMLVDVLTKFAGLLMVLYSFFCRSIRFLKYNILCS